VKAIRQGIESLSGSLVPLRQHAGQARAAAAGSGGLEPRLPHPDPRPEDRGRRRALQSAAPRLHAALHDRRDRTTAKSPAVAGPIAAKASSALPRSTVEDGREPRQRWRTGSQRARRPWSAVTHSPSSARGPSRPTAPESARPRASRPIGRHAAIDGGDRPLRHRDWLWHASRHKRRAPAMKPTTSPEDRPLTAEPPSRRPTGGRRCLTKPCSRAVVRPRTDRRGVAVALRADRATPPGARRPRPPLPAPRLALRRVVHARRTTGIAIPFYLAHSRLARLEESQMLEVEGGTPEWCMRILRHETGHAIDNAYRLQRRRRRQDLFGDRRSRTPRTTRRVPTAGASSFISSRGTRRAIRRRTSPRRSRSG